MLNQQFYNGSIRKMVTGFGSLFSQITIERQDPDLTSHIIRVPLTYAQKDPHLQRLLQDPDVNRPSEIQLPRMSFYNTSMTYDVDRKMQALNKIAVKDPMDANKLRFIYSPVPYNFAFSLWVYVKYVEDGTKIIEDIVSAFTPDITASIEFIPELCISHDVPIVLESVLPPQLYEGDIKTRRILIWQLDFTLKGYIYGPIRKKPIIKFINTNFYSANYRANVTPTSLANIKVEPGLTTNGTPTSNSAESIDRNLIFVDSDYGYIITEESP